MSNKNTKPTMKNSCSRAHIAIIDYLITFGMSRIFENAESEYPRTSGSLIGFSSSFTGSKAQVGDLIRLESAPTSKWRLSWLMEIRKHANGESEWLCKSIVDGELSWWSNVGIGILHRPTVKNNPHWKWNDKQFEFRDKWFKAGMKNDAYIYLTVSPTFRADGSAEISTRVRHRFSDYMATRVVENPGKSTIRSLSALYLEMIEEHKAQPKNRKES